MRLLYNYYYISSNSIIIELQQFCFSMVLFVNFLGKTSVHSREEANALISNMAGENYVVSEGKIVRDMMVLEDYSTVNIFVKLRGGKGGFGAKLKNQGGKKVKYNENMFSRDIQGRPIAYSTIEKDYKQFYERKVQEEQKVKKQLAQFKVMENTLKEEYAGKKLDRTYHAEMEETEKKLESSLKMGLHKYLEKKSIAKELPEEKIKETEFGATEEKDQARDSQQSTGKRPRKQREQDLQQEKGPIKRVKPDVLPESKKIETQKLVSARDKLKSLFKK